MFPRNLFPVAAALLAAAATLAPAFSQKAPDDAGAATSAEAAPPPTDAGADFIPGTRVLFEDNLSHEDLGMFPRSLRLKSGNVEIAAVGGKRFLRATSDSGSFEIPLSETLPKRFTLEFDYASSGNWSDSIYFTDSSDSEPFFIEYSALGGGVVGPENYRVATDLENPKPRTSTRVQIMADGDYVKMYMGGVRIANAPSARIGRSRKIRFNFTAASDAPAMFANFRVAAGGKDLYKALEDSGRVTAEGILFDTNSDRIRPESQPVLKEIAGMLTSHPDMRITIEGHTDNVGQSTANLTLSQKRADAVRAYLTKNLSVAAERLDAKGFGSTKPIADNDTEEGRQNNRRVELVKR